MKTNNKELENRVNKIKSALADLNFRDFVDEEALAKRAAAERAYFGIDEEKKTEDKNE